MNGRHGGAELARLIERSAELKRDLDREMLLGWRDPVEGIFEIRSRDRDAIVLLNLIDDLEYRTYSNMGPAALRRSRRCGGHLRLNHGDWNVSTTCHGGEHDRRRARWMP